ncbi:MAG: pyridoxamine 5'-phosphate oxidase family protein [Chloroflexota bacterium]
MSRVKSEVKARAGAVTDQRTETAPRSDAMLACRDQIDAYRVAEFVTLARDGSPVGWPLNPELEGDRLVFSTGYAYPGKARNAERDPRVAVLYSDPTASGRTDRDPLVLVQGRCEVLDKDLQANTERYVAQHIRTASPLAPMLKVPILRQLMVGYMTRIWMEVVPERVLSWHRTGVPPASLVASRPAGYTPGPGLRLPDQVTRWVSRYPRPPVLSFVDATGWPAATRVAATLGGDRILLDRTVGSVEGAPVALVFHQLTGNYRSNDAFLIRGYLDATGALVPERVVGYGGTADDRGVGSTKLLRLLFVDLRRDLKRKLEEEGRPVPRVRPPAATPRDR